MSYDPTTDFLGLLRQLSSGVEQARMPGLDYVVSALARTGLFKLSVGQTPPSVNQPSTVWLKPSQPSWVAEGTVYLWDASAGAYALATSALWAALLTPAGYLFQSATAPSNVVGIGTSLVAVQRSAPTSTALVLPSVANQWATGRPLKIADWSDTVTNHLITLTPVGGSTIMRQPSWSLLSTVDQLAGITLHASPDLNGWVIAP